MRLRESEISMIKRTALEVFGEDVEVFLFGSRVDDSKRGGDIDLYIKSKNKEDLFQKRSKFNIKLQDAIGEQKIDIIIAKNPNRDIEIEAIENGIKL